MTVAGRQHHNHGRLARAGFLLLGFVMLALGFIGALLPVMPTTIFLILAAWCFGRSSPRLEAWLLSHPAFGQLLLDWREHGAMSRKAKRAACIGIAIGYVLFLATASPSLWLACFVAGVMLASAIWIVKRPEGPDRSNSNRQP